MGDTTQNATPNVADQYLQNVNSFLPAVWIGELLLQYSELSFIDLITKRAPKIQGNQLIYNMVKEAETTSMTTAEFMANQGKFTLQTDITPTPLPIYLDQMEIWGFYANNILEIQSKSDLVTANVKSQAQKVTTKVSKAVLKKMFSSSGKNLGTVTIDRTNAYDHIIDMLTELDYANVPKFGRYIIMDHAYLAMLKKDPLFKDGVHLENGFIDGETIGGAHIIATNFLDFTPATSSENASGQIIVLQNDAYGYELQAEKVEHYTGAPGQFGETVQGFVLYGHGVLRPDSIVVSTCNYNPGLPEGVQEVLDV